MSATTRSLLCRSLLCCITQVLFSSADALADEVPPAGTPAAEHEHQDTQRSSDRSALRGLIPWGPAGTPLPAGAQLVTPEQFIQLIRSGTGKPLSPHGRGEGAGAEGDDDQEGKAPLDETRERLIHAFLKAHPELTDLARNLDDSPGARHGARRNRDGTWTAQAAGVSHPVEMLGRSSILAQVYDSVLFSQDRAGQAGLYSQIYQGLAYRATTQESRVLSEMLARLPSPESLQDANLETVGVALKTVGGLARAIYQLIPPSVREVLLGCDGETGATPRTNNYGDRSGSLPSCGPIPGGLYASVDFLNKDYPTCVKDQGRRGTCHTFANTSAVEERYSLDQGIKINLSEQDAMEHYRFSWQPAYFVDSGDAWEELNDILSRNYFYPLEQQWDYNPSNNRNTTVVPFTHSCDYVTSEPCSDTSPQAPMTCGRFDGALFCLLTSAPIVGSQYRPASAAYFWNAGDPELSAELMLLNLAFNNAVVWGFSVSPGFMGPAQGFVKYDPADLAAKPVGGHYLHIVSFVSNEDLRAKLPGAPPASGGGYFVAKNSWSSCFGDGGYVYLPWDYVKAQAFQGFSITQVN